MESGSACKVSSSCLNSVLGMMLTKVITAIGKGITSQANKISANNSHFCFRWYMINYAQHLSLLLTHTAVYRFQIVCHSLPLNTDILGTGELNGKVKGLKICQPPHQTSISKILWEMLLQKLHRILSCLPQSHGLGVKRENLSLNVLES